MKYGDIDDIIRRAEKAYLTYEESLRRSLDSLLETAQKAVLKSQKIYREFGINEICRRCDEEEGGSCCGVGIEVHYREPILIANLLEGISLPSYRLDEKSCYFLGREGCVLFFRHTLCVNFLCKRLYERLGTEKIICLQEAVEDEIKLTFRLCDAIWKIIQDDTKIDSG